MNSRARCPIRWQLSGGVHCKTPLWKDQNRKIGGPLKGSSTSRKIPPVKKTLWSASHLGPAEERAKSLPVLAPLGVGENGFAGLTDPCLMGDGLVNPRGKEKVGHLLKREREREVVRSVLEMIWKSRHLGPSWTGVFPTILKAQTAGPYLKLVEETPRMCAVID